MTISEAFRLIESLDDREDPDISWWVEFCTFGGKLNWLSKGHLAQFRMVEPLRLCQCYMISMKWQHDCFGPRGKSEISHAPLTPRVLDSCSTHLVHSILYKDESLDTSLIYKRIHQTCDW